ncbi:MAG: hypothetical protein ACRD0K_02350 [Egibacteraceae bacterium]
MMAAGRLLATGALMATLALAGCHSADRSSQQPGISIITQVDFGILRLQFDEDETPSGGMVDFGPLVITVNDLDVLVENRGSSAVTGIVITHAMRFATLEFEAGAEESAASAVINASTSQGACARDDREPDTVTFSCEVGTLDPGATATLMFALAEAVDAVSIMQNTQVEAALP